MAKLALLLTTLTVISSQVPPDLNYVLNTFCGGYVFTVLRKNMKIRNPNAFFQATSVTSGNISSCIAYVKLKVHYERASQICRWFPLIDEPHRKVNASVKPPTTKEHWNLTQTRIWVKKTGTKCFLTDTKHLDSVQEVSSCNDPKVAGHFVCHYGLGPWFRPHSKPNLYEKNPKIAPKANRCNSIVHNMMVKKFGMAHGKFYRTHVPNSLHKSSCLALILLKLSFTRAKEFCNSIPNAKIVTPETFEAKSFRIGNRDKMIWFQQIYGDQCQLTHKEDQMKIIDENCNKHHHFFCQYYGL